MAHLPACTIASNNYLAFARVLAASYQEHHPDAPVFVCVVDRPDPAIDYPSLPFTCVFAADLRIPCFESFAFRYDILELNTAVKPFFLAHLRDRYGLDRILYLDPDIWVLDTLTGIEEALDRHTVVLTPHVTRPLDDRYDPAERKILMVGVYNLGFLGIRLDRTTADFLEWWQDRLYRYCLADPHYGLFVDQLWMSLAPAYLDGVGVLRDPIYNVAYWNLPHRHPRAVGAQWQVDGRPLGFFHFSGLSIDDLDVISRHQNRLRPGDRPELRPLFEAYRDRVFAAGHGQLRGLPYGFARFTDTGIEIPGLARRILRRVDPEGRRWADPFVANGGDTFYTWLVEPIDLPLGYLNRAVLGLWEERMDLVHRFEQPCGDDLEGFVFWLQRQQEILPPPFLDRVRTKLPLPEPVGFDPQVPPRHVGWYDRAREVYLALDLRRPGAMREWLNEPWPGRRLERPVITRAAMLLHALRGDVRELFPDPLDRDQAAFAFWFCHTGAGEFALAPELVAPVLRTLSWRSRVSLLLHRLRGRGARAPTPAARSLALEQPAPATPVAAAVASPAPRRAPSRGVNLAAYFETGARSRLAHGTLEALERAGIAAVAIPIDQDTWGRMAGGRILQPQGAPYDVTVLQVALHETGHALGVVPAAATAAGVRIGYWYWDLAYLPVHLAHYFSCVDEVWVPSRFCAEALAGLADVPVLQLPPCVPAPAAPDRRWHAFDDARFTFFASVDARGLCALDNPFAAVETVRRLSRGGGVGLLLRVDNAAADPALVATLRKLSRGLPVVVHVDPAVDGVELMASCDAFLSLHRGGGLSIAAIEALYLEKPVVATAFGSTADVLDESTGFPVRYARSRMKDHVGPYAAGSVWAEPDPDDAVAQVERLLGDRDAAAQQAAAGRRRAQELYGVEAAARRLGDELTRFLDRA